MSDTDQSPASALVRENGTLKLCGLPLDAVLRQAEVQTPAYVYDLDAVGRAAREIATALGDRGLCCYAVKANGAAPIVRTIIAAGCGVDVVSGGELRLALACGARPSSIVYSGVAKRDDEIDFALTTGIRGIHAESVEELQRIAARARARSIVAPVGMRVNPSVEADTHANIATGHDEAKFGIAREDLPRALATLHDHASSLRLVSLSSHVGSMLMTTEPYIAGVKVLTDLARDVRAAGFALTYLDAGGGYGIPYRDDQSAVSPRTFVEAARRTLEEAGLAELDLVVEPGRALVAPYGVLLSTVIQSKRGTAGGVERRWILLDAGMNDLIRPALYQAHHRIEPVVDAGAARTKLRVAGPVCESSDDFGMHPLPALEDGALVAIREAGAYGRSMASTYNARPIASEVFLVNGEIASVRRAKTAEELVADEVR